MNYSKAYIKDYEYGKSYSFSGGVDLRNPENIKSDSTLSYVTNMWRDYCSPSGSVLSTVPGYRLIASLGKRINGIYSARLGEEDYIFVHSGSDLYAFLKGDRDSLLSDSGRLRTVAIGRLCDTRSSAFEFSGAFYIIDGNGYYRITKRGGELLLESVEKAAKDPEVSFNGKARMQKNMLSDLYTERFLGYKARECIDDYGLIYREYDAVNHYAEVVGSNAIREYVYVPGSAVVNGTVCTVKRIAAGAFSMRTFLKQVVLSAEVETILDGTDENSGAFSGCTQLATFVAHGVRYIGRHSFRYCYSLKRMWLASTLETVAQLYEDPFYSTRTLSEEGELYWCGDTASLDNVHDQRGEPCNLSSKFKITHTDCQLHFLEKGKTLSTGLFCGEANYYAGYKLTEYEGSSMTQTDSVADPTPGERWSVRCISPASFAALVFHSNTSLPKYVGVTVNEGETVLGDSLCEAYYYPLTLRARQISKITVDGEVIEYAPTRPFHYRCHCNAKLVMTDGFCTGAILTAKRGSLENAEIIFYCVNDSDGGSDISLREFANFANQLGYSGSYRDAVCKCRVSAVFDGRVFLTGNPALPGVVFYSERNADGCVDPAYFGSLSYINVGERGTTGVIMIPSPSYLALACEGSGNVYCITPVSTGVSYLERTYTVTFGTAGAGRVCAGISFYDDNVLLSEKGVESVYESRDRLDGGFRHRSASVDRELLTGAAELKNARLAIWEGYLVIAKGDRIYLADKRGGKDSEYDWYILDGICSYRGDVQRYYTRTVYPTSDTDYRMLGFLLSDEEVEVDPYTVLSEELDGERIFYVEKNGDKYMVDSDGERCGGEESVPTELYSDGTLLIFGTDDGSLVCFNNDKRGVSVGDERVESGEIHRSFYQRCNHRYLSAFASVSDNCGCPQVSKNTVRNSLILKMRADNSLSVGVKVRTNREPWQLLEVIKGGDMSFWGLDFDAVSHRAERDMTVICHENKRRWLEKQYYLYSDGYCKPMAVYSMAYRWRALGRVRERDI